MLLMQQKIEPTRANPQSTKQTETNQFRITWEEKQTPTFRRNLKLLPAGSTSPQPGCRKSRGQASSLNPARVRGFNIWGRKRRSVRAPRAVGCARVQSAQNSDVPVRERATAGFNFTAGLSQARVVPQRNPGDF